MMTPSTGKRRRPTHAERGLPTAKRVQFRLYHDDELALQRLVYDGRYGKNRSKVVRALIRRADGELRAEKEARRRT
jgi:Arc/MetJ-type ribon-helix-helix transcriptional regulator